MSGESHVTVKIPKELVEEMDKLLGRHGFRSRGEIAKEAIRRFMENYKDILEAPVLADLNLNEHGVQIAEIQGNKIVGVAQIYFKPPNKVFCEKDESSDCRHVEFALELPEVQEILRKKGWKPKQG